MSLTTCSLKITPNSECTMHCNILEKQNMRNRRTQDAQEPETWAINFTLAAARYPAS